jgi:chromate transporter
MGVKTMDDGKLLGLVLLCLPLSLLSFGGGQSIVAGLQHQTVDVYNWLNAQQFTELFAISRAAPGPSTLIVALIGWQVAGIWGALAASFAIFAPSSLLICLVGRWWEGHRRSRWSVAVEQGLLPIAVGLILSSTLTIAQFASLRTIDYVVIVSAGLVLRFTKIGPYPILATVAVLYFCMSLMGV